MDERTARLVLNMVPGLGPVRFRQLLARFGDAPAILEASAEAIGATYGIGPGLAADIASWRETLPWAAQLATAKRLGVSVVVPGDPGYPAMLGQIHDPPIVLYRWSDAATDDRRALAVVGSRRTTLYGQETARRLAFQLAELGFTVVSGLARGIDTAAHQGALQGRGTTLAVVGAGVDVIYPAENAGLAREIRAAGALVSEFPLGTPPDKRHFPMRNRIIAGTALGVVVVEADRTSGALITARLALEQGRLVFAVPGRITSLQSRGPHALIKEGAKLVEGIEDILEEFEYLFPPRRVPASRAPAADAAATAPPAATPELAPDEQALVALLEPGAPLAIDELAARSGTAIGIAAGILFQLELKRVVRQLPGKRFVLDQPMAETP